MIKIIGVAIKNTMLKDLNENDYESMRKGEHTEKLDKIGDFINELESFCAEQFDENYLGVNIDGSLVVLVFKNEIGKKGAKQVIETLATKGLVAEIRGKGFADERYFTDNKFNNFLVDLPLPYVDKAICEFFERNNLEYVIDQQLDGNCVTYTADLGLQEIMFIANSQFLGGGMHNRKNHATIEPQKNYKKIIASVEDDYLDWREKHPVS